MIPTTEPVKTNSKLQPSTLLGNLVSGANNYWRGSRKINKTVLYLNGTTDYLVITNPILEDVFTIDLWFFLFSNSDTLQTIISQGQFSIGVLQSKLIVKCVSDVVGSTIINANQWYHIALVRNGSIAKLYLDGVQEVIHLSFTEPNREPIQLGALNSGYLFNGYIDSLRIRSEESWTSSFSIPNQSDYISDEYWEDNTIVLQGRVYNFPPDLNYRYTAFQLGMDSYNNSVYTSPYDDCGNRGTTFVGNAKIVNTHFRHSYPSISFDGYDDAIVVQNSSSLQFGTEFTLEFWAIDLNSKYTLFDKRTSNTTTGLLIYSDIDSKLYVKLGDSTSGWEIEITSGVLSLGWHHFALVRETSGSTKLYVDGTQSGNIVSSSVNFDNAANLIIGRNINNSEYYNKNLDEISLTKEAKYLSNFTVPQKKVSAINEEKDYTSLLLHFDGVNNSVDFIDSSKYLHQIAGYNGAIISTAQSKFGGSSLYLNGSSGVVISPSEYTTLGEDDFTIEFWCRFDSANSTSRPIVSSWVGGITIPGPWWTLHISSANKIIFYWAGNLNTILLTGNTTIAGTTWYHIALTRYGDQWTLWLNGAIDATVYHQSTYRKGYQLLSEKSDLYGITIGDYFDTTLKYNNAGVNDYSGYIDELRITKGVAVFKEPFIPPTVAYSPSSNYPFINQNNVLSLTIDDDYYIRDFSSKQQKITLEGSIVSGKVIGGSSAYFDGTGDGIRYTSTVGDAAIRSDDFTVEAWVNPINGGYLSQSYGRIIETEQLGTTGGFCVAMNNTGNTNPCDAVLFSSRVGSNTELFLSTVSPLTNSAWNHIAFTRENGLFTSYLNGVPKQRKWADSCFDVDRKYSTLSLTNLNKTVSGISSANSISVASKMFFDSDSATQGYYFEVLLVASGDKWYIGLADSTWSPQTVNVYVGSTAKSWGYITTTGNKVNNASNTAWSGIASTTNDIIGVAVKNGKMWISKNGSWLMSGNPEIEANPMFSNLSGPVTAAVTQYTASVTATLTLRTNPSEFSYRVPIGYRSINETPYSQIFTKSKISVGCNNSALESFYGFIDDVRISRRKARYQIPWTQKSIITDANAAYVTLLLNCNGINNGTSIVDSSQSVKTVTVNSVVTVTDEYRFGSSSAFFNGTSSYLSLIDSDDWYYGTGNFTIEFWYKFRTPPYGAYTETTAQTLYDQKSDSNNYFTITASKSGFTVDMKSGGVSLSTISISQPPDSSLWHHFALVRNSNTLIVYIDGVELSNTAFSQTAPNISAILNIGRSSAGNQLFNGWIDDFRITKGVARYPAEFNYSKPPAGLLPPPRKFKRAAETNHYPVSYSTASQANTKFDVSIACVATDDTYTGNIGFEILRSFSLTTNKFDFTFEGWFYPLVTGTTRYVFSHGISTGGLGFAVSQNSLSMRYSTSNLTASVNITGWNHIAFQRVGSLRQIYLNGVKIAEDTLDVDLNVYDIITEIGSCASYTDANRFFGYIDGIRFTRGIPRYTSSFTPPSEVFNRYKEFPNTKLMLFFNKISQLPSSVKVMGYPKCVKISGLSSDGACWFDGIRDFIQLHQVASLSKEDFTVEFWIDLHSFGSLDKPIWIWSQSNTLSNSNMVAIQSKSNKIILLLGSTEYVLGEVKPYAWNHIALTQKSNVIRGFLNGVKSIEQSGFSVVSATNTIGLVFDENISPNENRLKGFIDNFRILKNICLYESNFTPSTTLSVQPEGESQFLYDNGSSLEIGNFIGQLDEVLISDSITSLSAEQRLNDSSKNILSYSATKTYGVSAPTSFRADYSFHYGPGDIWGIVTDSVGTPMRRRITLKEYWSNTIIMETESDPVSGYYEFTELDLDSVFTIVGEDYLDYRYNDVIRAKVKAEVRLNT